MKFSIFIENLKQLEYDIFMNEKHKMNQGSVPAEVNVYSTNIGIEPNILVVDGKIIIQ
jgi:hypothetical protein